MFFNLFKKSVVVVEPEEPVDREKALKEFIEPIDKMIDAFEIGVGFKNSEKGNPSYSISYRAISNKYNDLLGYSDLELEDVRNRLRDKINKDLEHRDSLYCINCKHYKNKNCYHSSQTTKSLVTGDLGLYNDTESVEDVRRDHCQGFNFESMDNNLE